MLKTLLSFLPPPYSLSRLFTLLIFLSGKQALMMVISLEIMAMFRKVEEESRGLELFFSDLACSLSSWMGTVAGGIGTLFWHCGFLCRHNWYASRPLVPEEHCVLGLSVWFAEFIAEHRSCALGRLEKTRDDTVVCILISFTILKSLNLDVLQGATLTYAFFFFFLWVRITAFEDFWSTFAISFRELCLNYWVGFWYELLHLERFFIHSTIYC